MTFLDLHREVPQSGILPNFTHAPCQPSQNTEAIKHLSHFDSKSRCEMHITHFICSYRLDYEIVVVLVS